MSRARMIASSMVLVASITLAAWGGDIQAAEEGSQGRGGVSAAEPSKISSRLLHALGFTPGGGFSGQPWAADVGTLNITPQGLQVYIEVEEVRPEFIEQLKVLSVTIEIAEPALKLVQARIPLDRLEHVSRLPFVTFIRPPDYGYPNRQGSVGTQGDSVIGADTIRRNLGVIGTGIRVGVLSDGIAGLNQSVASGDLPPGVSSRSFRADGNLNAGAEGTAILEIIYDIAPGAALFFANFATSVEFIQAVNWLADQAGGPNTRRGTPAGVDIIVEDVAFFNTGPYDGSSPVSQALSNAVLRGVAVFAAVGNYAQAHYQGLFTDTDGDTLHEFDVSLGLPRVDNAGETLNVTLQPGEMISILLQWNDPFGASTNDYDLCVYDPPDVPRAPLFCSTTRQNGNANPTEALSITRTASTPGTLGMGIINVQGKAAPRVLDVFILGGVMNEFIVPDSSVPNVGDAQFVISTGAVPWQTPAAIEPFSSRGPTEDGRVKPELVAPDGVSVTGAGGFPTPFFGTSAAAPHAGAVGALILSADPTLTPALLTATMTATADGLGPSSPNNIFGYGRVDAFRVFNPTIRIAGDFDGDGKTDLAVFSPNLGLWFVLQSSTGQVRTVQFGWSASIPVPADYDGDGKTDLAVLDPVASVWYILQSSTGQLRTAQFGLQEEW